jgi:hypothetical protein
MKIKLAPGKIALSFLLVIVFLVLFNILGLILFFGIDGYQVFDIVYWFEFDHEGNVPAIYSGIVLLLCSFLLFIITVSTHGNRYVHCGYWFFLSLLFAYLSCDEVLEIHERLGDYSRQFVTAKGFLYFPWVIPYGILLTLFVTAYAGFLSALPQRIRILFVMSGIVFVSGAIGFEVFGAREADLYGCNSIKYCVLYTLEESCEMIGIVLFLYALLTYIKHEIPVLSIFRTKKITFL